MINGCQASNLFIYQTTLQKIDQRTVCSKARVEVKKYLSFGQQIRYYNSEHNVVNQLSTLNRLIFNLHLLQTRLCKMSETHGRSTEQLFSEAKAIHSSHRTQSTELENKLDFMQKKIQDHSSFLSCGFCTRSTKKVDDAFKRAFKTLSLTEQVTFFWRICILVRQIKEKKNLSEELQIKNPQHQMLDTTIYIKDGREYKVWTVTRIQASLKTKKIIITDTSAVLDMHDYLIRHAKNKQKQCFALEAINLQQPLQTIKISNQGHGFDETLKFFKKMKKRALFDYVCSMIDPAILQQQLTVETKPASTSRIGRKASIKIAFLPFEPGSMFDKMMTLKLVSPEYSKKPIKLIQKQILQRECVIRLRDSSYNQIYKALVPPKLIEKIDQVNGQWQKVQISEECEIYHHRKEQKVKKIYRFKCSDIVLFDWIVDELNNFSNFRKWKPKMERIQCLKVFPSQKTKVYHQVCKHEPNSRVNYVFVRHYFNLPNPHYIGQKSKKFHFYYDQSVTSPIAKQYFSIGEPLAEISYILWKFFEEKDAVNLVIEAKCDHFTTPQKNLKMVETYLGQFDMLKKHAANYVDESQIDNDVILNTLMFQNQYIQKIDEIQDIDHDTEYYTIADSNNSGKENTLLGKRTPQPNLNRSLAHKSLERRVSFEDNNSPSQTNCLKFRHPVVPYKKGKPKLVMPSRPGQHFHWEKQWIVNGKGQLINTNQQKIQAQNNVLKNVIKRLGRNIFKGKGILSISLPVDAFGDDSNLSRLCNSYGYAPVFLQDAAKMQDPLERFKKVMSFGISASVIYIRMDKPFNPILGETYQSLVDGCPVYGEQISHHPPISAVFLKGRGYTLYGHLEAKVEMSMNSASGINEGQIHVSFDQDDLSKRQVMYTSPAGQLGGLIFGDRKMSLIKRSVYFDPDNLIYCELRWSKQKGKSDFINKYYDAVEGEIVKLKPGFNKAAWKCGVKKEQIEKELGLINGRWTGAVFYEDQLLFDTYKTYPHQVQYYHAMLESDVEKRKDLLLRRNAVDMEPAQAAKEELQQIQRNDRKLRAQYGKNGH